METYNQNDFKEEGLDLVFVQDNQSMSTKNVLRMDLQYEVMKQKLFTNVLISITQTTKAASSGMTQILESSGLWKF